MPAMHRRNLLASAIALNLSFALPVRAQQYPDKPVRIIVPYPAGGPLDMLARMMGQQLAAQTSRTFLVENKPGAAGNIGSEFVASAPPDGYTLLLSGSNITIAPALYKGTTKFDPVGSFTHIGRLVTMPTVFVVKESSPYATLADLLAAARANPGKITYGTPGTGSPSQIAMELLKRAARVDIQAVPYKGSANAMTDLLGGQIDIVPSVAAGVVAHIRSGRMRGLAVTSLQRDPQLPEVRTVAEMFPGFEVAAWLGISAPKGLSPDVAGFLERQLVRAVAEPSVAASLRSAAMNLAWLDGRQASAMIGAEAEQYSKVIRDANLTPD